MDRHVGVGPFGSSRVRSGEWSVVLAAGENQNPRSRQALERLCAVYWYPIYGFVRGRGFGPEQAEDLTRGFFADVIQRKSIGAARRQRAWFRSFLLSSVKNYVASGSARNCTGLNGTVAASPPSPLHAAEIRYRSEPLDGATQEEVFEKRWAIALLERALVRLREETDRRGHTSHYAALSPYLAGDPEGRSYRHVAEELQVGDGAVKTAVQRMRKRFAQLLREEVGRTVDHPGRIEEEIQHLFGATGH